MADSLLMNFNTALNERAADLAAATDAQDVESIVRAARTEAIERTGIPNTFVYKATVVVLGLAVLSVVAGQLWLTLDGKEIPQGMVAIGSAAIGALAGLLAPTSN